MRDYDDMALLFPALYFGVDNNSNYQSSITYSLNNFVMPTGNYNYGNADYSNQWVQEVISSHRIELTNDGSGALYSIQVTNPVLDSFYPIPLLRDSPSSGSLINEKAVSDSDSFQTWLMFKPINGQWVPPKVVNWNWSGQGTNEWPGPANQDLGDYWVLTSSGHATNPPDAYTTTYPTWTNNILQFHLQKQ